MTDLELVRACAEAMGHTDITHYTGRIYARDSEGLRVFDPIHDDAQAMALLKRFPIAISVLRGGGWTLACDATGAWASYTDLNRGICECVAKMWEASPARTQKIA
jgi:hypothetical protein